MSKVRASEIPVLELETNTERASKVVLEEARVAERDDGIDAIILGCAGMVEVVDTVRKRLSVTVIDPVECAAQCMTWLVQKA